MAAGHIPATNGLTTTYAYDDDLTDNSGLDNQYSAQLAVLATRGTTFGAGSDGSAVAVTNPAGETSVQIRDGLGRTVLAINPEGHASTIQHDTMVAQGGIGVPPVSINLPGSLLSTTQTDPNGNSSTQFTDAADRTLAQKDPANFLTFAAYDPNSNQVANRDPNITQ